MVAACPWLCYGRHTELHIYYAVQINLLNQSSINVHPPLREGCDAVKSVFRVGFDMVQLFFNISG